MPSGNQGILWPGASQVSLIWRRNRLIANNELHSFKSPWSLISVVRSSVVLTNLGELKSTFGIPLHLIDRTLATAATYAQSAVTFGLT